MSYGDKHVKLNEIEAELIKMVDKSNSKELNDLISKAIVSILEVNIIICEKIEKEQSIKN